MNSAIEVGEPDWRPLERALPSEYCEDFMYIAHVGDIVLYKHRITRLWLKSEEGHTRPAIATLALFRGHQGTLAVELWNAENKALRGTVAPAFYTAAGEVLDLPNLFEGAIRKITGAVACPGCKHTHVAVAPATNKGGEI